MKTRRKNPSRGPKQLTAEDWFTPAEWRKMQAAVRRSKRAIKAGRSIRVRDAEAFCRSLG